jgi:hypothetical protein
MRACQLLRGLTILLLSGISAQAITVDVLTTPTLLLRPNDGATYTFAILIDVTPGIGEGAGGLFPIVFQGLFTQYDWANLTIPPNRVGARLTFAAPLRVGCTNSPTPDVFGPLGTFNNDADTAEYLFPTQMVSTGAVKIECVLVDPNAPGPPFMPENRDIEDIFPPAPTPDDPGRNDLRQNNLFDIGSGVNPVSPIPEPGSAGLTALGIIIAGITFRSRRAVGRFLSR